MAQCQKSAQAFVRDAFNPIVGVICSEEANVICQKNHLSFVELLLPFSRITSPIHIRDASNISVNLQDFSVQFRDVNNLPPQQTLGVKLLTEAVGVCFPTQKEQHITSGGYEIRIAASTPWYEEYRECFLNIITPSDHEFLRHYAACVFVVSSTHSDPMSQFAQLTITQHQQQQQTPAKLPKWFAADLCRYYVLLHDCTEGEDPKAEAVYQSMKSKYGVHSCHLLRINSVLPNTEETPSNETLPDPWSNFIRPRSSMPSKEHQEMKTNGILDSKQVNSDTVDHPLGPSTTEKSYSGVPRRPRTRSVSERGCWLSSHDHDRLKTFVQEFVVRAVIPWAERLIKAYNELYQSKKRAGSLIKSLFNRGKQTESKPVSGGYLPESPEMQLRRLGDLCFMFQLYEQAYSVYHTLKKDFEGDKTWLYCAGAQEMAGLSIFMQGAAAQRNYPTHYLDGAIDVYQTCRSQSFMTRSVLLSTEVLKVKGLWLQAASQFLKLTGEEFDLRSAVLLEQAAYCYLNMSPPQIRKFAFYMVLAGHRYSKSSQRKHSLRCYTVSSQVYEGRDWTLAENHIGVSVSRLSSQLSLSLQALSHASKLLTESSEQPHQQCVFLKEYLQLYQKVKADEGEKWRSEMAVPQMVDNEVMVTTEQFEMPTNSTVYSDDVRWTQLEEACVLKSQGSLPLVFIKSTPSYNKYMTNTHCPRAVLGETQFVRVMVYNPLGVVLQLTQVGISWRFQPSGEENFSFDSKNNPDVVEQTNIPVIDLLPLSRQWILFRLVPKALGILNLLSINYHVAYKDVSSELLSSPVQGELLLTVRGPRLNSSVKDKTSVSYADDQRLYINIQSELPKLQVIFQSLPDNMLCGEIVRVPVKLTNVGSVALRRLHVTCNEPQMVTFSDYTDVQDYSPFSRKVIELDTRVATLSPADSLDVELWIRAEDTPMSKPLNFLFYYELADDSTGTKIRHRCSRYSFVITTTSGLTTQCNTHIRAVKDATHLGSYLSSILVHNCSKQSHEAATEFAVTDILCKSSGWRVTSLCSESPPNVRVNQSEVALLNVYLTQLHKDKTQCLSRVHLNSEQVAMGDEIVDSFLSVPFVQSEQPPAGEGDQSDPCVAVVGVVWKRFRMDVNGITTQSAGLHCLPILTMSEEVETRAGRSPSFNNQFTVLEIPRRPTYTELAAPRQHADCRVEYQLLYESHFMVDLSKHRVCVFPVTLVLKSYSNVDVEVCIQHQNVDGLMWSGKTCSKVRISPYQETSLHMAVTILRYGVYDLNSLAVTTLDNTFVRHPASVPHLLIVEKG